MGFGFAGAAAGLGEGLLSWAEEREKMANDLLKMEKADEIRRGQMDYAAELKGRGGGGGGGGGGRRSSGGSGSDDSLSSEDGVGRALTDRQRDDVGNYWKSAFGDDYDGVVKPSLAEFEAQLESTWRKDETLGQAARRIQEEWSEQDVTETTEVPRSPLSPMRIFGDDTYTQETTERVGGFGNAATPAPEGAPQVEQILQEARDAIARGASREAVIARLREQGIDPKGL